MPFNFCTALSFAWRNCVGFITIFCLFFNSRLWLVIQRDSLLLTFSIFWSFRWFIEHFRLRECWSEAWKNDLPWFAKTARYWYFPLTFAYDPECDSKHCRNMVTISLSTTISSNFPGAQRSARDVFLFSSSKRAKVVLANWPTTLQKLSYTPEFGLSLRESSYLVWKTSSTSELFLWINCSFLYDLLP